MAEETYGTKSYITIAGVDVTQYVVSWNYSPAIEHGIDEIQILLTSNVQNVVSFVNNAEVIVKRGKTTGMETYVFRGNISTFSPKIASFEVIAKDKLWQLAKLEVTTVYENTDSFGGVISAIAQDLIESYGGLVADVEDTGDYFVLQRFWCISAKIYDRLQTLRKILDFVLFYDPESDKVVFKSKGFETHPFVLQYNADGTTNVFSIIKWDYDTENIRNRITIVGGLTDSNQSESFTGTGGLDTFTLAKVPESINVQNPANTPKTLGVRDGSGVYDYYVDKASKKVVFVTNTSASGVVIDYNAKEPAVATADDESSISLYGLSEDTFYYPDIITNKDAELKTNDLLSRLASPIPTATNIYIPQHPVLIKPGMQILIQDTVNNINRYLTVTRITFQYPQIYDILDVGEEPIFEKESVQDIMERISQLEKSEAPDTGTANIIKQYKSFPRIKLSRETYTQDTTLYGSWGKGFGDGATGGTYLWGQSPGVWQATGSNPNLEVLDSLDHQDSTWEEEIIDTDFLIASETDATVDTSTGRIDFS